MARSEAGESVTSRVLRVIEAFDVYHPVMSVSDIARRAELPMTTAHRLVGELLEANILERADARNVRLGVRLWEMATRSSRVMRLRDAAMPYMQQLHVQVRHHTQLGLLDGSDVLYVERLSALVTIDNAIFVAGRLPWHMASAGLALMAFAPPEVQAEELSKPLSRATNHTVSDPARLSAMLADIRRRRYVVARAMTLENATGLAAPVFDSEGRAIAALSLVVPREGGAEERYINELLLAAQGITRRIEELIDYERRPPMSSKYFAIHRNAHE